MKKITVLLAVFMFGRLFCQEGRIGINTSTPKTTMDVNGKTDGLGVALSSDMAGLQAPRLSRLELTNKGTIYGAEQRGALIYITNTSGGDSLLSRVNITAAGYYYFDGSTWIKLVIGSENPIITASNGLTKTADNIKLGGTLTEETTIANAGFNTIINGTGKVGIGNAIPTEMLDVGGNVKFSGALMPNNIPGANLQILKSTSADSAPVWGPDINTLGNGTGRINSPNATSTVITPCNTTVINKNVTLLRIFSNLDGNNNGVFLELLVTTGANTGVQQLHNLKYNGGAVVVDTSVAGTWTYDLGSGIFKLIISGSNRPFTVRFEGGAGTFTGNVVYECMR